MHKDNVFSLNKNSSESINILENTVELLSLKVKARTEAMKHTQKLKGSMLIVLLLNIVLATATTSFSTRIFDEIIKTKSTENVVISPASIKTCLGLAYMGAEGETAAELFQTLQLKGSTKDEVGEEFRTSIQKVESSGADMKTANRIYLADRYEIATKYNELTTKYFQAQAEKVDFSAPETAGKINAWVEAQTNQKIKQAIAPGSLDSSVSAILVNAIYFKATWQYKFPETQTKDKDFHVNGQSSTVPVKMMHQTAKLRYTELSELDATGVEIPYDKTDIRMLILLPNKIDGLSSLEEKLKNVDLNNLNFWTTKVNLQLPKFKIEFKVSLNNVLQNLGIKHMFRDGDFSSLTSDKTQLMVSDVNHKAFIEVDEKGTEAAAVTDIFMTRTLPSPRDLPHDFHVDHPFFFAIKDDETIYFAGHITKF